MGKLFQWHCPIRGSCICPYSIIITVIIVDNGGSNNNGLNIHCYMVSCVVLYVWSC